MTDWRKAAESFTTDMDVKYDGYMKQRTKMSLFHSTPEGELARKNAVNNMKQQRIDEYGRKFIIHSPGNDILDLYDEAWRQWKEEGKKTGAWCEIPPSEVFRIRYRTELPQLRGRPRPGQKGPWTIVKEELEKWHSTDDKTYWAQIAKRRYAWLVDTPSNETVECLIAHQFKDFQKNRFGHYTKQATGWKIGDVKVFTKKGKGAGWLAECVAV